MLLDRYERHVLFSLGRVGILRNVGKIRKMFDERKWIADYITDDVNKTVECIIVTDEDEQFTGTSVLSSEDERFVPRYGRMIAFARAILSYYNAKNGADFFLTGAEAWDLVRGEGIFFWEPRDRENTADVVDSIRNVLRKVWG